VADPVAFGFAVSLARPGGISEGWRIIPRSLAAKELSCSKRHFPGYLLWRSSATHVNRRIRSMKRRKRASSWHLNYNPWHPKCYRCRDHESKIGNSGWRR